MRRACVSLLLLAALLVPAAAPADDGDQARTRVACAGGRAELRLERKDDAGRSLIEVELRLDARGGTQALRVVLLHERRLVYSGVRRTTASGTYRLRRTVPDWPGRETVTARVGTTGGRTCVLATAL